jgi:signal transduction histidine kinase
MGPAVGILRSQLLIVTAIALIVGIVVARYTAKRLARPISDIEKKARELAKGNYDVSFEGGDYKEVSDLAETLNQAAADLKASDALQKDLIANVAHDLRTPLTMIKSYAELIRDISGDDPKKREEHLEVIINETDRLDELVGDILTLSKMQAGVMEMEMTDFDIQEAGESVLSTYKVMENEGFTISFRPVPGPVMVHGDRHRIQQVIANLLSNAVRYSKDRKDVVLSFSRSGGRIVCSVEDKGIGIAEEDLEKIWNRYQKASKQGARSTQGTGLGLSIASEILQKHDAEYGVESKPGEGSRFWFSLPVNK